MIRRLWVGLLFGAAFLGPAKGAIDLTGTELTWLEAAMPVLTFAREQDLPLDIIVQRLPTPGESALGMAYVDGRCKLVLSMRGNAEAQATLDRIPQGLLGPVVEAIAAHELGHCWRHLRQSWGTVPAGIGTMPLAGRLKPEQIELLTDMWRTRREEAYADLVGLAWTLGHHRGLYGDVHAWYVRLRAKQAVYTGPHDTRLWVRLASDPGQFAPAATIFDQVEPLWLSGLRAENWLTPPAPPT
jgi:hypothetical protein